MSELAELRAADLRERCAMMQVHLANFVDEATDDALERAIRTAVTALGRVRLLAGARSEHEAG